MASRDEAQDNILIIGPSWVGDMVMAQSLFILLKCRRPSCRITVLAPAWTKPLLDRMPEVDASFDLPFGHGELKLAARRRFGVSLREAAYTQAIVLPNSLKSALIPWFANIPLRTGWRGEARGLLLNDCRVLDKTRYPLMVERFDALAFERGAELPAKLPDPRLIVRRDEVDAVLTRFGIATDSQRPLLAVCPGAEFGPSKQWPAEQFASTCAELIRLGWRVALFGSSGDSAIAQEISKGIVTKIGAELARNSYNVAGQTNLEEAIDLMAGCSAVLSNDSGLMHIGAALELPVVALYGSTSPDFTPPLTNRSRLLASDIECRPCFDRTCRFGHGRCMTELKPEHAVRALLDLQENYFENSNEARR